MQADRMQTSPGQYNPNNRIQNNPGQYNPTRWLAISKRERINLDWDDLISAKASRM